MQIVDGVLYNVEEGDLINGELCIPKEVKSFKNNAIWRIKKCENFKSLTFEEGSEINRISEDVFSNSLCLEKVDFSNCKYLCDIKECAFKGCSKLVSVEFSKCGELTRIEQEAFKNCVSLKGVSFTGCDKLELVEEKAFYGCEGLSYADFHGCESLKKIGENAFEDCTGLEWADFSRCKKLNCLDTGAFKGCAELKKVIVDHCDLLTILGNECFYNCVSLEEVKGLDKILGFRHIGGWCFAKSGLKEIIFPKVKNEDGMGIIVYDSAFYKCNRLERVIGENCKMRGLCGYTFEDCKNLKYVSFKDSKIWSIQYPFKDCDKLEVVDLRGVTGIAYLTLSPTMANTVLISNSAKWDAPERYNQAFVKDTQILVFNKKGEVTRQFVIGDGNQYENVRIGANHFVTSLEAKGVKMPFCALNSLHSDSEVKLFLDKKNAKQYENMMSACFGDERNESEYFVEFLRKLGYFGFEDIETGKVDPLKVDEYKKYKRLLARNLVQSKIKNDIKVDINKGYINKIINEKVMEVADRHSLNDLVYSFVMNNIASNKHKDELLKALKCVKWTEKKDVSFAQFMVLNFDDIMDKTVLGRDWGKYIANGVDNYARYDGFYSNGVLRFDVLFEKFQSVLASSNKKVVTRSDNNRLTIDDFRDGPMYQGVTEENKELAECCSKFNITQEGFDFLSDLLKEGRAVKDKQVLRVCEDEVASGKDLSDERNADLITYKVLEKGDPLGLIIGNLTNCCQRYGGVGQNCMTVGATDVNSTFLTINKGGKMLAQGWIWYDPKTQTVAIDNIEAPEVVKDIVNNEKRGEIGECIQRFCDNAFRTMNENGHKVSNVVIGACNTDVWRLKDTYEKETDTDRLIDCPYYMASDYGEEVEVYSDVAKEGQYVVYRGGKSMRKDHNTKNSIISRFGRNY